jgi:hypothetical protein
MLYIYSINITLHMHIGNYLSNMAIFMEEAI